VVVQEKTGNRLRTRGEPARDKRHPHPALPHRSPSFILSHLGNEGRVLKRHGEVAYESELAADLLLLYLPRRSRLCSRQYRKTHDFGQSGWNEPHDSPAHTKMRKMRPLYLTGLVSLN
jgi:hypothetical protein